MSPLEGKLIDFLAEIKKQATQLFTIVNVSIHLKQLHKMFQLILD